MTPNGRRTCHVRRRAAAHPAIQRQPHLAEQLRRWEDAAATGDATQARRAAAEIGRNLDAAHTALAAAGQIVETSITNR